MIRLTAHADVSAPVGVTWRPCPVLGPFHGAWIPDETSLIAALNRAPREDVLLLRDGPGWHLVLVRGEVADTITPWPLRRLGTGPYIFHPADVAPSLEPPAWATGGENVVGRIVEGRVAWSKWKEGDALSPGDLLRLPIPSVVVPMRTPRATLAPYGEFPRFDSDRVPDPPRLDREEGRRLAGLKDTSPWWSRLWFWKRPPSAVEWSKLGRSKPGFLRSLLRVFDRQKSIFDRLARLFERGDLDTALKHSIPIDNSLVTKLKNSGWLSLSWILPTNLVDFSLSRLFRPGDRVAAVALDGGRVAHLATLYRKAAEQLSAQGRFRQSAYVYAHLLADYARAALELEKGGFHLESAALLKQRMGNIRDAGQVLERGGYVPEAVKLYLDHRLFEEGVQASERAGMADEATRCLALWLADLTKRGLRIQAGDLYRDRLRDLASARAQYDGELRTSQGRRGEAGVRLVELDDLEGRRDLPSWERCEAILRAGLEKSTGFLEAMKDLVGFHREVRAWAAVRPLPEETTRQLHRRTRSSLMEAISVAQAHRRDEARGEAVSFLSTHLESGQDPLVIDDVRRNLGVGVGEAPEGRPAWKRRTGGFMHLDGLFLCWVRDAYALLDGSGAMRTPVRRLPFLAVSMAKENAKPERVRIGMVSHDHRLTELVLHGDELLVEASGGIPGAVSITHAMGDFGYLIGTNRGEVIHLTEINRTPHHRKLSEDNEGGAVTAMAWLQTGLYRALSRGSLVLGGLDPEGEPGMLVRNELGSLTRMVETENALIGVGVGLEFGILEAGFEYLMRRIPADVSAEGLTSIASLDRPHHPTGRLALGYESGRIVIAEFAGGGAAALRLVETFRTSLGPIVALGPLPFDRLLAVDLDFTCAILDLVSMSLEYQGPWEPDRRSA